MATVELEDLISRIQAGALPFDGRPDEITDVTVVNENGDVEELTNDETSFLTTIFKDVKESDPSQEPSDNSLFDVRKEVDGTTQSQEEINAAIYDKKDIVPPPFNPDIFVKFLEVDEIHFRCVRTKVVDSVGRDYQLVPTVTTIPEGQEKSPTSDAVPAETIKQDASVIKKFISKANAVMGFAGVLDRAAMDLESIGWCGIEIIRSLDKRIARIAYIPASRLRVLKGWKGFAEITGPDKYTYYQPFGCKVVTKNRKNPVTNEPDFYDPEDDGELQGTDDKFEWNLIDRNTGKKTSNLNTAANEILYLTKAHIATLYYGISDVLPAAGSLIGNVHIRDYFLQFFEHNAIPRYAIIIKGARVAPDVKDTIIKYFSQHVKGRAHKTLIIPLPAGRGDVDIRFEKLGPDTQEASFLNTKKDNQQSIMTAHGVSPAIIGINEAASLGSGKGLSQAEIYKDRIVTPSQKMWGEQLNKLFRLGLGVQTVALVFNPLDIRDLVEEMNTNKGYLEKGAMTINESRKISGIGEPIKGGDRAFVLTNDGLRFIDELDDETSDIITKLEEELQGTKDQMANQAILNKAMQARQQSNGMAKESANGKQVVKA